MAFFVDFALFFRTIDGLLRYGALENSDKNGHLTVYEKSVFERNRTFMIKILISAFLGQKSLKKNL
jgi:hypothetical protein